MTGRESRAHRDTTVKVLSDDVEPFTMLWIAVRSKCSLCKKDAFFKAHVLDKHRNKTVQGGASIVG